MDPERRSFLRVETDLMVSCSAIDAAGGRGAPFPAQAVNLSAGGARIVPAARPTPQPAPGARYWLEIEFARPRFLVFAEAVVVWVDDEGFAVRFDEMEEYTRQRGVRWVYAQDRRLFERRAQARIPIRLRARCTRVTPDGEPVEEFAAPTLDVSLDGVRLRTDRVLPPGTAIDLELDFADGLPPMTARTTAETVSGDDGSREVVLWLHEPNPAQRRRLIERALAAERRNRT